MKLIAVDIYFNLNNLYTPIQVARSPIHVPILFKITFTSVTQVLENVIIGKCINL